MAKKNNSVCAICGKPYYCCQNSMEVKTFTPWKTIVDTLEHYKIFLTIRDYTNKYIDAQEARERLLKCDLTDMDTFQDGTKRAIDKIMKESEPPKAKRTRKNNE